MVTNKRICLRIPSKNFDSQIMCVASVSKQSARKDVADYGGPGAAAKARRRDLALPHIYPLRRVGFPVLLNATMSATSVHFRL